MKWSLLSNFNKLTNFYSNKKLTKIIHLDKNLNNILPDFRLIYKTNFLINDKINLFNTYY